MLDLFENEYREKYGENYNFRFSYNISENDLNIREKYERLFSEFYNLKVFLHKIAEIYTKNEKDSFDTSSLMCEKVEIINNSSEKNFSPIITFCSNGEFHLEDLIVIGNPNELDSFNYIFNPS